MNFRKVLIANRGEIACRLIRGCKKMGYQTVAVYSEADRQALHVGLADEAVCIGAAAASESYLSIDKILASAQLSGADALHPGYGFLSERADFAQAVQAAGLVFIGPDPSAIEAMGPKSAAKTRMLAAGVPCVPGYQGADQSDATLVLEANRVGLPVMVKAAAGGGGRGMRLVHHEGDLLSAIQSARSEATQAFGEGQLLIEKAVLNARHVEIQIFGDRHGQVVHLGERDCTVQRRHQKVVEEAPSPAVDEALRERMGAAAVAAARAVHYVGAGTVEFMLEPSGAFYFLEMNTRLQVEHPVTEAVYDLDLVEWQLRVAQGEALPLSQVQINARRQGWAMEVRLCTEDPAQDFMPQTGPLLAWRAPTGEGMRVDHGLREGGVVSPHYDAMQAKLIASGPTRDAARHKLLQMLDEVLLLGVHSNLDLLQHIIAHPFFVEGQLSTGFMAEHFPAELLARSGQPSPLHAALAAALLVHGAAEQLCADAELTPDMMHWQSSAPATVAVLIRTAQVELKTRVKALSGAHYQVDTGDAVVDIELIALRPPELQFSHQGVAQRAHFARTEDGIWVRHQGVTLMYQDLTLAAPEKAAAGSDGTLLAPMDGKVMAVLAAPGQRVEPGQTLAVLEAMKMEFQIRSGLAGVVESVPCHVGQQVKARQVLVTLMPSAAETQNRQSPE